MGLRISEGTDIRQRSVFITYDNLEYYTWLFFHDAMIVLAFNYVRHQSLNLLGSNQAGTGLKKSLYAVLLQVAFPDGYLTVIFIHFRAIALRSPLIPQKSLYIEVPHKANPICQAGGASIDLPYRMQAREQVSIDISRADEELVRCLKEKMENISSSVTICRVPEEIHKGKTRYYYPDLVAIGPYHRDKPNVKDMERHKWRYLFALLNRKPNLEANLQECVKAMRELEHRARRCYAGDIGLTSDEFVELMLVDGGFIIELLIKCAHKSLRRRGDPLFSTPGKLFDLRLDMILLENQIPLFVLQRLFQVSPIPQQCTMPLSELSFRFFKSMVPGGEQQDLQAKLNEEAHHILDSVHNCLLPPTFPREPSKQPPTQIPIKCATDLRAGGIKLRKASSRNLLDAKFVNGILRIPSLNIDQCTERLFRNLVALERCGCVNTPCITSYVFLIHGLIGSDKDEKLLVDRQIITNSLNGEAKAHAMFSDLCKDMTVDESYYEGLHDQLDAYMERQVTGSRRRHQETTHLPEYPPKVGYRALVALSLLTLTLTSVGTLISALSFFLHRS